ncbi:MAG TPA: T9SS type A sorting domain-containing protein [Bacteroidales bacterium]
MNRRFLIISLLAILWIPMQAQEILTGIEYNASIQNLRHEAARHPIQKAAQVAENLKLPFTDDFSKRLFFPDPQLWVDSAAFINTDYAVEEPTTGVATLDAINSFGAIYPEAGSFPFPADYLTSRPISLDSNFVLSRPMKRSDSLYISFFYQPQGTGSAPARNDSLILQFHSPLEVDTIIFNGHTTIVPVWRNVWASMGMSLDEFRAKYHTAFRQVLVPISDSARYFQNGFQFRFRNYASLANNILPSWQSNGCQWNIDYIDLNTGRSLHDTVHKDIAFAGRAPSMLKNYEAMPYSQYRANFINEMQDSLSMFVSNLDSTTYNISYHYDVTRDFGIPVHSYNGGSIFIDPFASNGYLDWPSIAHPPVDFLYPIGSQQKVFFKTVHYITTDPTLEVKSNDTLSFTQIFSNYYAYDDGTAEAGYGLNPAGAKLAYKFTLNRNDSLRAVQMFFNQSRSGGNLQYFTLTVWNDYYGKPGDVIYEKSSVKAIFTDSLNKFQTFFLDSLLFIDDVKYPGRIFYIGWQQTTADNLNVGFDRYNDARQHTFYNTSGEWLQSNFRGALMIRPIVGLANPLGIDQPDVAQNSFGLFPNPASDLVNIAIPPSCKKAAISGELMIIIRDMTNRTSYNRPYSQQVDVGSFSTGMYLVSLINLQSHEQFFSKLLIAR